MGEQDQNSFNQNHSKSKVRIFIAVFVVVVVLVGGYSWLNYLSPTAKQKRFEEGVKVYEEAVSDYQRALREDTYGGATPEETLRLFVEALKNEDIELASKYFWFDASGDRSEWLRGLEQAQESNRLSQIIDIVSAAELDPTLKGVDENSVWFVTVDENNEVVADINLYFNSSANTWKIKSL